MIRAVSWNLWWRFGDDWRARQAAIASTLEALRPDIVGLQEVWATPTTSQSDVLAEHLGMHAAFAAPSLPPPPEPVEHPEQRGVELGVAILSRWPIARVVDHPLPTTHRREAPVALAVAVEHPAGALHVFVAAVEWEPRFADDQLAQTQQLAALVRDESLDGPLPVLLAVDLNAPPGSPEVGVLTEVMVDTWIEGGGAPDTPTLSSSNPLSPTAAWRQIDERIDYVLARPGTPDRPVVVRRAFRAGDRPIRDIYASDHYATVADVEIEKRWCPADRRCGRSGRTALPTSGGRSPVCCHHRRLGTST